VYRSIFSNTVLRITWGFKKMLHTDRRMSAHCKLRVIFLIITHQLTVTLNSSIFGTTCHIKLCWMFLKRTVFESRDWLWPWQWWRKVKSHCDISVTPKIYIPFKKTLDWYTFVSCACELILSLFFCSVWLELHKNLTRGCISFTAYEWEKNIEEDTEK
jgi:hypothetical protein